MNVYENMHAAVTGTFVSTMGTMTCKAAATATMGFTAGFGMCTLTAGITS